VVGICYLRCLCGIGAATVVVGVVVAVGNTIAVGITITAVVAASYGHDGGLGKYSNVASNEGVQVSSRCPSVLNTSADISRRSRLEMSSQGVSLAPSRYADENDVKVGDVGVSRDRKPGCVAVLS